MKTRMIFSLGLSALVFGGTMMGCTAQGSGIASASNPNTDAAAKQAARQADKARKAMARQDDQAVIHFAEAAVELSPRDVGYRLLLAHGYLRAGRFGSARTAFTDVLELTPDDGRAALNLALAEVALGDWSQARQTLDAHAATIPVSDRGLALALAGDPAAAVQLLNQAARSPGADAKLRQNLALSLALAGNWTGARVVAAADMSAADVDARLQQWAAFAQPKGASDQVATLLGVTPVSDSGQPVALALNAPAAADKAVLAAVDQPAAAAPAAVAAPQLAEAAPAAPPMLAKIVFAPSSPVVQPLPTMMIRPSRPAGMAAVRPRMAPVFAPVATAAARGDWVVQIGAFANAGVAKDGWDRATRRFGQLAGHQPTGTRFMSRDGAVYRLSVSGFARTDADRLCRAYRASGGACFVRRQAGDQMAQWTKAPLQVAAR
ncbi:MULTISPECIES: SPOR domain-containing protein [unclassified Sphingomonas]|uniref:SPOR domain-containing protein n=1 Tax=unclassified Sphingomonas TaxID=196159 RepID=UPI00226AECD9|nr:MULTISPECIES: SPOR domain-containing protein [unclassified Sphingomonas]